MSVVFLLLALGTLGGAAAAVSLRNPVHCALALTVALLGVACIYLELGAEFVGFAQVLVYVGAVAILVVFALLLTRGGAPLTAGVLSHGWPVGIAAAALLFALLSGAILHTGAALPGSALAPKVSVRAIGEALMGRFALPLELVGALLTVASIGAVIVAMQEKGEAE